MRQLHRFPFVLGTVLALLAGPGVRAQTTTTGQAPAIAPAAEPGSAQKPAAPVKNPLNRNPVRRAQLPPDNAPLAPPDPRDSTTRPTLPPTSTDGRDTVLPPPEAPASDARKP